MEISLGVKVSTRSYFSSRLLWSARHSSELAGQIEAVHDGAPTFDIEHQALVLSSIIASAAFLEAVINEFFQDAVDAHGLEGDGYLAPLPESAYRAMDDLWRSTGEGSGL